jgi:hypothetical protein
MIMGAMDDQFMMLPNSNLGGPQAFTAINKQITSLKTIQKTTDDFSLTNGFGLLGKGPVQKIPLTGVSMSTVVRESSRTETLEAD